MKFERATKTQARLRMALMGPSGSGKTFSALSIGKHLGSKVAVIDTERGSASKYADEFEFDRLELESFSPLTFIEAISAAKAGGYDVLIIDSLSHAWMGKGGSLEQHDKEVDRQKTKNTYTAWRAVTRDHNALVEAILQYPGHVISTMRTKTAHVQEKDDRGVTVVRKVGMEPIQRDGMEYEFDVTADIDLNHTLTVAKTRCRALDGASINKPGQEIAEILTGWLSSGSPDTSAARMEAKQAAMSALKAFYLSKGKSLEEWSEYCEQHLASLSTDDLKSRLEQWKSLPADKKKETAHA